MGNPTKMWGFCIVCFVRDWESLVNPPALGAGDPLVRIQDYGQNILKWACSLIGKTSASKAVVECSNHSGPAKQYDAISDRREPRYERGVRVSRVRTKTKLLTSHAI